MHHDQENHCKARLFSHLGTCAGRFRWDPTAGKKRGNVVNPWEIVGKYLTGPIGPFRPFKTDGRESETRFPRLTHRYHLSGLRFLAPAPLVAVMILGLGASASAELTAKDALVAQPCHELIDSDKPDSDKLLEACPQCVKYYSYRAKQETGESHNPLSLLAGYCYMGQAMGELQKSEMSDAKEHLILSQSIFRYILLHSDNADLKNQTRGYLAIVNNVLEKAFHDK
jgi:hypothetical protein